MANSQIAGIKRPAGGLANYSAGFVTAFILCTGAVFCSPAHAFEPSHDTDEDDLFLKIEGFPARAHYCQIMVTQPGALSPSFTGNKLSSRLPGGHPGFANITATRSSYKIVVDAPMAFTNMPSNGGDGVRFHASYSATGNTNFGRTRDGVARKIKRGHTRIKTHLVAKRQGSSFPHGQYSAQITLRCE
ncbi:MAG: hypothetical protein QM488_09030 [Rhizobiaceae bacterium]